jgi:hypothetical protein|nr:MAG TPA: hypothetical protein [Caudoviricetes sp.]
MKNIERLIALSQMDDTIDFSSVVRIAADEAQEKFDNWSERTQESEKGETMQEYIDHLNSAADAFDEAFSELNEALEMDV